MVAKFLHLMTIAGFATCFSYSNNSNPSSYIPKESPLEQSVEMKQKSLDASSPFYFACAQPSRASYFQSRN